MSSDTGGVPLHAKGILNPKQKRKKETGRKEGRKEGKRKEKHLKSTHFGYCNPKIK